MQGKKRYQEKLFLSFQLSDHVPEDNFYRRLKEVVDFNFLYLRTADYYGKEGQKSVDPVVFMKLMLVGYLENLGSDRRIISMAKMRLDILYFLGYDIDEELPWHSTLSRTRQLLGEDVFIEVFRNILKQCIDKGMVAGKRQAVDSVFVKANASLDSLVEREVLEDAATYSKELVANQQTEQVAVVAIKDKDHNKPGKGDEDKPSNKTHFSPTDPDAKMSVKPGKATALNYLSQVGVDTASYLITHIQSFKADLRDSQCLPDFITNLLDNFNQTGICVEEIIADTAYSSGEALKSLEAADITGYIPNRAQFKSERPGFTYNEEGDFYICPNNEKLIYKGIFESLKGVYNKEYRISKTICNKCPLKGCCPCYPANPKKSPLLRETVDRAYYQRMHERMKTRKAKRLMKVRQSTVEPVIGTLVNYLGMKKVNTKGLKQSNKCMTLAATAYNIKKLLNHMTHLVQAATKQMETGWKTAVKCILNTYYPVKYLYQWSLTFKGAKIVFNMGPAKT
jgi:transposase